MFNYDDLSFAFSKPPSTGTIKVFPEDFKVNEILGFDLSGEGEHLFLNVEKKGLNTEELVRALARALDKPEKSISYAGLKDRHALTTQWLCVHCLGENPPNIETLAGAGWRVVKAVRHLKKLKTGVLAANEFKLVLRELTQKTDIDKRLLDIQSQGVPNYFGTQRFGFNGQNLIKAEAMLLGGKKEKNRFLRGLYYSAARSFLFNLLLAERVKLANWSHALDGDVMQLAGNNSVFTIATADEVINERLASFDISPAAVLWGRGEERASLEALALQERILHPFKEWCASLEQHGLERAYRALRLHPQEMNWHWQDEQTLELYFKLEAGSYATSVIRELIILVEHE
ncbi:MAG: tRNA pseudouridine(13) synthase TruD [Tatlockia sp.]|nr:tRNA pseudouridine(13) synthase TruD [Tatlockia sp.]